MRFDGYNRHDFHYARTSRDAFGSPFYPEKKPQPVKDFLKWLAFSVGLVCLSIILKGML